MSRKIVVFAAVPPPEHGQNRMVAAMLEALRTDPPHDVLHVNARLSHTLDEIGEGSLRKILLSFRYIAEAILLAVKHKGAMLYYVPGPVKFSALIRDWLTLGLLRLWYRDVVFHWHAIGQGEWAHGSERISLPAPRPIDAMARRISALFLENPFLSICVSHNSTRDALAVGSRRVEIVPNGIDDPCPRDGTWNRIRQERLRPRTRSADDPVKLLFLSHGTEAKGLFDLLDALLLCAESPDWQDRHAVLTLAGGISGSIIGRYGERKLMLGKAWKGRLEIRELGFVEGKEKSRCYEEHDLFLAPSRWESFGLTVVEAMAHGLPVVGAASDGVVGILGQDYPFMARVSDPRSLSKNINQAVEQWEKGNLASLSDSLRKRFESDFTLDSFRSGIRHAFSFEDRAGTHGHGRPLEIMAYLADQNPNHGRSLGISRMTEVILRSLSARKDVRLGAIVSKFSIKAPPGSSPLVNIPWDTRGRIRRAVTDNLHPLFALPKRRPDVWYFPKGFMPRVNGTVQPSVATIHDTIIQYYQDHHPKWRQELEYNYWAGMLRNTLLHATAVMTVSQHAKRQIEEFIHRYQLPEREIHVTYESCLYENIPQPFNPPKADHVVHLGSLEPHKRTAWLVRLWAEWAESDSELPKLHVIGKIPEEVVAIAVACPKIIHLPYLEDKALVTQLTTAEALILPSEIEGFGLPAIEAYYLGAPVCHVKGTSVEEILRPATTKGGFNLDHPESLRAALDEVLSMSAGEIRSCGLKLRDEYHTSKVVSQMLEVFHKAAV